MFLVSGYRSGGLVVVGLGGVGLNLNLITLLTLSSYTSSGFSRCEASVAGGLGSCRCLGGCRPLGGCIRSVGTTNGYGPSFGLNVTLRTTRFGGRRLMCYLTNDGFGRVATNGTVGVSSYIGSSNDASFSLIGRFIGGTRSTSVAVCNRALT